MGQFEGHFGICLAYGGDFGVILGPVWAYKRRMAGMMRVVAGLMVSLSAPRGPINRKYTFLQRILLVQDGPEYAKAANNAAKRVILGSL